MLSLEAQVAEKLAELIEKAPAGGIFHDVAIYRAVTGPDGPQRLQLRLPEGDVEVSVAALERVGG